MTRAKRITTHDGKPVRVGMELWRMETRDGGVTWFARSGSRVVGKINRKMGGTVTLLEPFSTCMSGECRLFSSLKAAQAEARKRTASVTEIKPAKRRRKPNAK